MSRAPTVGDLVTCRRRELAAAGLEPEVGILLVERRRDALVLFPRLSRSAWLAKQALKTADPEAEDAPAEVHATPPWMRRAHRVYRLVGGHRIELETSDEDRLEVRIGCGDLDPPCLDRLRELLGETADEMRIRPGSMSHLVVSFPAEPASHGSGADSVDTESASS